MEDTSSTRYDPSPIRPTAFAFWSSKAETSEHGVAVSYDTSQTCWRRLRADRKPQSFAAPHLRGAAVHSNPFDFQRKWSGVEISSPESSPFDPETAWIENRSKWAA